MDERLKKIIDNSDNIVFFGGAGVSTESNNSYDICPYRDPNDTTLGYTNETTCIDAVNEFNVKKDSCFMVLHKPGMPLPIFLQGIVSQLDM